MVRFSQETFVRLSRLCLNSSDNHSFSRKKLFSFPREKSLTFNLRFAKLNPTISN